MRQILKKFSLIALILFACQFYLSGIVLAFDSEAYEFMSAEIDSLGMVKDAFSIIPVSPTSDKLSEQAADIKNSMTQLNNAKQPFNKFKDSSNDYISKSADAFQRIYASAVTLNEEKLALVEKMSGMSAEEMRLNQDTLANYGDSLAAKYELFWKSMSQAVTLSTYSLVNYTIKKDDKNIYCTVSRDEESRLIKQLEGIFGEEIKGDTALMKHKFVSIPAVIRTFLTTTDLKPSDVY